MDQAQHHLRSQYTDVFYLPIEFDIVPDGLRPMDPEFQAEIDRRIVELLDVHAIHHRTLRGTVEERLDDMLGVLGA